MKTISLATAKLYIAEEQQILREAYQSFFDAHPHFDVVDISSDTSKESLEYAIWKYRPEAVLLGLRTLDASVTARLETVRQHCPNTAVVLLYAQFDADGIEAARQFTRNASSGCAYLLKHTVNTLEQLAQTIESVVDGQMILDPSVIHGLVAPPNEESGFLGQLTPREREVLNWIAQGYKNGVIASLMCLELKTIERHINSIYTKLGAAGDANSRHMRVYAVTEYLKAGGNANPLPEPSNPFANTRAAARIQRMPSLHHAA